MDKTDKFFSSLNYLFPDELTVLKRYSLFSRMLRQHLADMGYNKALRSHDLAMRYHNGTRKDGTPEFLHQQSQALYTLAFVRANLLEKDIIESLLCANFKHDLFEDFGRGPNPLTIVDIAEKTTTEGAEHSALLSKTDHRGQEKPHYREELLQRPLLWIAKKEDRTHNEATRIGGYFKVASGYKPSHVSGFSNEKIRTYNASTRKNFINSEEETYSRYDDYRDALREFEKILTYECDVIDIWQAGGSSPKPPTLEAFNQLPGGINPVKVLQDRVANTPYSYAPKVDKAISLKLN